MNEFDLNLGQFIDQFSNKAIEGIENVIKGTLWEMSSRVVKRTPVGDPNLWSFPPPPGYTGGMARGNWFASISSPHVGTVNKIDKSGNVTLAGMADDIDRAPGEVFYLTNNLDYMKRLEYDAWSTQAPQGMVRVTLAELNVVINEKIESLPDR